MNHQKVLENAKNMFDPRPLKYDLVLDKGGKFCAQKAYKKSWKSWFVAGFITLDCLISYKIFCFNVLKIWLFSLKKKP